MTQQGAHSAADRGPTRLPSVTVKIAQTLDGRIATRTGDSRWITNEQSRARVQLLRHEYDAILVGAGTAVADDPVLTDRSGLRRHRPLVRVLLDDELRLSPDSRLAQTAREIPLIIYTSTAADARAADMLIARGAEIVRAPHGARDLRAVLADLHGRSLQSVFVEGGARVAGMFLDAGLVDKVSFFVAPLIIGGHEAPPAVAGTGATRLADAMRLKDVEITEHAGDVEITGYPKTATSDE